MSFLLLNLYVYDFTKTTYDLYYLYSYICKTNIRNNKSEVNLAKPTVDIAKHTVNIAKHTVNIANFIYFF